LEFGSVVLIELVGPGERYSVESPGKPEHEGRIKRENGARRVAVEFDRERLSIFVDELVLWTQKAGPGELRGIKVVASGDGNEAVTLDDIVVTIPQPRSESRAWADLTADAVRSPEGDETFGKIAAVGPAGVTLTVKDRKTSHAWPELSEFAHRRTAISERLTTGEHVRLRIRAADAARDIVAGAVQKMNDTTLVLDHPLLGELTIPRNRLEEIRLLFHGRSLPIDSTPRHLGTRPASGFAVPKPEGLRFVKTVSITPFPEKGFVVVDAARIAASGTPVEVRVNRESAGILNRLADRAEATVRSYRLPLPNITERECEIEIRLQPLEIGRRVTGVYLRGVRLELHDRR
jgi:hypothetical protein